MRPEPRQKSKSRVYFTIKDRPSVSIGVKAVSRETGGLFRDAAVESSP